MNKIDYNIKSWPQVPKRAWKVGDRFRVRHNSDGPRILACIDQRYCMVDLNTGNQASGLHDTIESLYAEDHDIYTKI